MKGFSRAKLTLNPRNTREENQPKFLLDLGLELTVFFKLRGLKIFRGKEREMVEFGESFGFPRAANNCVLGRQTVFCKQVPNFC